MKTIIKNKNTISEKDNIIILSNKKSKLTNFNLSSDEIKYVIKQQKSNKEKKKEPGMTAKEKKAAKKAKKNERGRMGE